MWLSKSVKIDFAAFKHNTDVWQTDGQTDIHCTTA